MLDENSEDCLSVHVEGTRHLGLTDLSLFCPIAAETLDGDSGDRDAHEVLQELNEIVLPFVEKYAA